MVAFERLQGSLLQLLDDRIHHREAVSHTTGIVAHRLDCIGLDWIGLS